MAKSAPKKTELLNLHVNLLHPQGAPTQIPSKFLKWLAGYGRFIVIFVEIIVISCFLYRFKLDADLDRINQDIKAEAQTIDAKKNDETLIRQTQQKLQLIKQTFDNSPDWRNLINIITAKVPQGVSFKNLNIEHSQNTHGLQFKITGQTNSTSDVSAFLRALKELDKDEKDRQFSDITLTSIGFDTGIISFTISGSTK